MERFSNDAQTTLNGAITNSAVSLVLTSATGFPTAAPFRLRIENEIILVGAISGATCSSLTRGAEGTTAASHATATVVEHVLTAAALEGAFARLGPIAAQTVQSEADVAAFTIKEKAGGQTAPLFQVLDDANRVMLRMAAGPDQTLYLGPGDPSETGGYFILDKGVGKYSGVMFYEAGITHWFMDHDSGKNFGLNRYDDSGAYLANVFAVMKSTGHFFLLAGQQTPNDASVFSIGPTAALPTDAKLDVRSPSSGPLYGARFAKVVASTNAPAVTMSVGAISTGTATDGFGPGIWFQIGNSSADKAANSIASLWVVRDGADTQGAFKFNTGNGNTERMRISNNGNIGIGGISYGGGVQVMFLANATTIPNSNPTAGGILYVENGALKWRGSSGTVTQLAAA